MIAYRVVYIGGSRRMSPIGGREEDVIISISNWSNLLFTCLSKNHALASDLLQ